MEILQQVGQWSWYLLWSLLLITASLFVYLGLGGTFIIIGLALIHALATGFDPVTWKLLLILLGLALLGEGIEFVVGTFYVAKKGATKYGVIGAFVGGLAGATLGNGVLPGGGGHPGEFCRRFRRRGTGGVLRSRKTGTESAHRGSRLSRPATGHPHQTRHRPGYGVPHSPGDHPGFLTIPPDCEY